MKKTTRNASIRRLSFLDCFQRKKTDSIKHYEGYFLWPPWLVSQYIKPTRDNMAALVEFTHEAFHRVSCDLLGTYVQIK